LHSGGLLGKDAGISHTLISLSEPIGARMNFIIFFLCNIVSIAPASSWDVGKTAATAMLALVALDDHLPSQRRLDTLNDGVHVCHHDRAEGRNRKGAGGGVAAELGELRRERRGRG
jgi:hypothetical protein